MNLEIYLIGAAVLIAIVALLSSKLVRTVCREALHHPRDNCEIEARGPEVTVKQAKVDQGAEG